MMPAITQKPAPSGVPSLPRSTAPPRPLNVPSGEELAALYARSRNVRVREQTILEYRNLVEILSAKMARKGAPIEDLVQVGTIGLIQALDRFDPDRGVKF